MQESRIPSYAISMMKPPSLFADDIITPVYVAPTRSPTTFRPKHHKENIQERPSCDDEEDCEEGSGEPVTTEEIFVTSTTGPFFHLIFSFNSLLMLLISFFFFSSLSFSLFFSHFIPSSPSTLVFRTLDLKSRTKHTITLSVLIFRAWFPLVHFPVCTAVRAHATDEAFPHLSVRFSIDFYWPSMHRKFVRWPLWSGGCEVVLAFHSKRGLWKYYWKSVCLLSCWKEFVANISTRNSYIYIVSGIFSSHDFLVGSKYSLSLSFSFCNRYIDLSYLPFFFLFSFSRARILQIRAFTKLRLIYLNSSLKIFNFNNLQFIFLFLFSK